MMNIRALRVSLKPELAAKLLGFPKPAHHLGGGLRAFQWYHATSIEAVAVGPSALRRARIACLTYSDSVVRLAWAARSSASVSAFGARIRRLIV
jgi:hypothetical protein